MSNVLIGIIGVILFIGLALAGAMFLGPRFQQTTSDSKASAMVQQASQVARANQLYRVDNGTYSPAGASTPLVSAGYLKVLPVNPMNPTWGYNSLDADGDYVGNPAYIIAGIDVDGTQVGRDVCNSMGRQSGQALDAQGNVSVVTSLSQLKADSGCLYITQTVGKIGPGRYAFSRI